MNYGSTRSNKSQTQRRKQKARRAQIKQSRSERRRLTQQHADQHVAVYRANQTLQAIDEVQHWRRILERVNSVNNGHPRSGLR